MFWLKDYITNIQSLLVEGDDSALTYAALEARLAIERISYERLKVAHNYISADDLRTWKPQYIVETLIDEVDSRIAEEWTLSIGAKEGETTTEYLPIGTQKGFDPKYLSQLWQALSSFLHTTVPKDSKVPIKHYRDASVMRPKIETALREIERISEGSIVGAVVFKQISFTCTCGQINKRSADRLKDLSIVNCISQKCPEQYQVEKRNNEVFFERRLLDISCHSCGELHQFPYKPLTTMPKDQQGTFECSSCKENNAFGWRLMQLKKVESTTDS